MIPGEAAAQAAAAAAEEQSLARKVAAAVEGHFRVRKVVAAKRILRQVAETLPAHMLTVQTKDWAPAQPEGVLEQNVEEPAAAAVLEKVVSEENQCRRSGVQRKRKQERRSGPVICPTPSLLHLELYPLLDAALNELGRHMGQLLHPSFLSSFVSITLARGSRGLVFRSLGRTGVLLY